MTPRESAIAERLHDAAGRIPVDTSPDRVIEHELRRTSARIRRPRSSVALVAASAAALVGAIAVAVQVTAGSSTDRTSDVATTPTDPDSPEDVAAHVAEPPAWFGEPVGGHRDGALRTGRWVSTTIGKVVGDEPGNDGVEAFDDPIVVAVFDGGYAPLAGATPITIDGAPHRLIRYDGWQAIATDGPDGTPTVMVSGPVDRATLGVVLDAVDVVDRSGSFSVRLRTVPPGYTEIVAPQVLGRDPAQRRTLASSSGGIGVDNVSDVPEPLLAAAQTGADLTAVDVGGEVGWTGRTSAHPHGPLEFLIWSPSPGVVLEISTDDPDRSVRDLIDLARATSLLPADEWDARYDDD